MKLSAKTAEALIESLLQIPEHHMPRGIYQSFILYSYSYFSPASAIPLCPD